MNESGNVIACVADALNLLYKGFRRVGGPAATQVSNVSVCHSMCQLPKFFPSKLTK